MNFKQTVPSPLYKQAVTLHPHRFKGRVRAKPGETPITSKWSLYVDASCGPLTHVAAKDFLALMRTTFGQPLRRAKQAKDLVIKVRIGDKRLSRPESYHLRVECNQVVIDAFDDEGAMRAIFHLGWRMINRRAAILQRGCWARVPQWSLRITSPLLHKPRDTPQDYLDLPEAYLLNMARYGYNATYIYMDWFDYMSPTVAGALARPGWAKRLSDLRRATEYLSRFGIRLLFHINTLPLRANHPLFFKTPNYRGAQTFHEGLHCLCSSSPKVLALYRRAAKQLFDDVPALGGAVLITGGECFLHCYTRPFPKPAGGTNCPRCRKRKPERVIANIVNVFVQGARQANKNVDILMWPYSAFSWGDLAAQKRLLKGLDPRTGCLASFEKDDWTSVNGTRSYIFDYSISQMGPSPRFRSLLGAAQQSGLKTYAKTESSVCIEMFYLPRIPIMHRWAERFSKLRSQNLAGVHTSWRMQGFSAQRNDEIVDYYNWEDDPDIVQFLTIIAERDFGPRAAPLVVAAWQQFSKTFAKFPYSAGVTGFPYFRGPFSLGPAHPFVFDLTSPIGLSSRFWSVDPSMEEILVDSKRLEATRQPRFFVDLTWTQPFGATTMAGSLSRIDRGWQKGLAKLLAARSRTRGRYRHALQSEFDVAQLIGSMFRTAHHLVQFQRLREQLTLKACTQDRLQQTCQQVVELLEAEAANAMEILPAIERDSSLGYSATYGRAFDAKLLCEKIAHTQRQIHKVVPRFFSQYAFHIFGSCDNLVVRNSGNAKVISGTPRC